METWRDVPGYEGLYMVSSAGRVRRHDGLLLRQRVDKYGYASVHLRSNGHRRNHFVHRLVCQAFNPIASPQLMEVDHINCHKLDNRVENLEWVTGEENRRRALENAQIGRPCKAIVGTSNIGKIVYFSSLTEAAKHGFSSTGISACLHGRAATSKHYRWKLA